MKYVIKNRWSGQSIFEAELGAEYGGQSESIRLGGAIRLAVKARADLADANLAGADLTGVYLADADLARADLTSAYLAGANLAGANLAGVYLADANLTSADLAGANLTRADFAGAYLAGANLTGADLAGANLAGADLTGADLAGANLTRADFAGAYLAGANLARASLADANLTSADLAGANLAGANLARASLAGAKNSELAQALTIIAPREGEIISWKACADNVLVKLRVPPEAKRSNATSRKCRAEYVEVLEVIGASFGVSRHDGKTTYHVGETVHCDKWDDDRWNECSGGIHFFLTREEAEDWL